MKIAPEEFSNSSVSFVTLFRSNGTAVGGSFSGYLLAKSSQDVDLIFGTAIAVCIGGVFIL